MALPLIERGELEAAAEILGSVRPFEHRFFLQPILIEAQARLAVAQDRGEEALELLTECGRHERDWDIRTPALTTWRAEAALALAALGHCDDSVEFADEGLEAARSFGAPRALGMSLRAAGMTHGGESGLDLLRNAVAVLDASPAALEHARALVDLGAALRRANARAAAREPLGEGMSLARRCGATPWPSAPTTSFSPPAPNRGRSCSRASRR